jgi:hypothetical protein
MHECPLQPDHPLAGWSDLCLALGGSPDSFTGRLLELIQKADPGNKRRLRLGFPQHVAALDLWMRCAPELTAGELRDHIGRIPDPS